MNATHKGIEMFSLGDTIRSYDFAGLDNCYMEGVVVGVSEISRTLRCKTTKQVFDGYSVKKLPDFFTVPMLGELLADASTESPRLVKL